MASTKGNTRDSSGGNPDSSDDTSEDENQDDDEDGSVLPSTRTKSVQKCNKCSVRSCPGLSEVTGVCSAPKCERLVHKTCHVNLLKKHNLFHIPDTLACTKGCYEKIQRFHNPSNLGWNNDGKHGPNDPNTSEKILIELLQQTDHRGKSLYNSMRQGRITPDGKGRSKADWGAFLTSCINSKGESRNSFATPDVLYAVLPY